MPEDIQRRKSAALNLLNQIQCLQQANVDLQVKVYAYEQIFQRFFPDFNLEAGIKAIIEEIENRIQASSQEEQQCQSIMPSKSRESQFHSAKLMD